MAVLLIPPYLQFSDDNGNPLAGGKVYTYQAGTTTPKATFTDNTETVQAANPVILDSAGRATMWGAGAYKFMVYDANDVLIRTTDNFTTYVTSDSTGNSYFQTFSGTGSQTAFTTSENLGTDENAILVFVADGLEAHIANGDFATDTIWTKGAFWTIGAGVATATGASSTALSQTATVTLLAGQSYNLTYTVTRSAGGIIPSIGGVNGTERTASGTYRETIIAGSTQTIAFTGNAFTGTLDAISITTSDAKGYDLQSPSSYTINGTTLTFGVAPPVGTGNIYVTAPSLLVASANAAAAAADASATLAANSATAAAASAALASQNVKTKPAVACATTANITLSGEQTIDAVATSASRVLVKDQTDATQNGVYVSAAGAWTRAADADTWAELQGQSVFVLGGTVNIGKTFANTNEAGGTIGVTDVTWTESFVGMFKSVYDPANIAQQVVGTTATQTLTDKTLTTPTINQPIINGVTDASSAGAGVLGQYIESTVLLGAALALTSGTPRTVTSISLTAGEWDVSALGQFTSGGTTTTTLMEAVIGLTTNNATPAGVCGVNRLNSSAVGTNPGHFMPVGPVRINVSTTTTVFLVANSTFSTSTMSAYGQIRARRIR